jgi:hypothetical protein
MGASQKTLGRFFSRSMPRIPYKCRHGVLREANAPRVRKKSSATLAPESAKTHAMLAMHDAPAAGLLVKQTFQSVQPTRVARQGFAGRWQS